MSNFIINHKYCPECGGRIKGYYYYCGKCGNHDLINWKYTGIFWLITGAIFLVAMYSVTKNFCANTFFSQVEFCKYFKN